MEKEVLFTEDEAKELFQDIDETEEFGSDIKDVVVLDGVKAYLNSISNHRRLTAEEKEQLATLLAKMKLRASNYMDGR